MTEINSNQNIYNTIQRQRISPNHVPSFLNITGVGQKAMGIVKKVSYDAAQNIGNQIDTITTETELIDNIINENTNATEIAITSNISDELLLAKTINFVEYNNEIPQTSNNISVVISEKHAVKEKTNINKLIAAIQYSDNYNIDAQKKVLLEAVKTLADWLDNLITNYRQNVRIGYSRGDSEVKLSFLLKLRNQIENCDFPIGFGNDEEFAAEAEQGIITLGCYKNDYYLDEYLNLTDNAQDNNAARTHFNKSILLNAAVFLPMRKFTSEAEATAALNAAANDPSSRIHFDQYDIMMSSDDFYYNYTKTYLASVLAHELTHAMHFANEVIAYNTCEMLEDDMRNLPVCLNWDEATLTAAGRIFPNLDLRNVTYGEVDLPIDDTHSVSFHDNAVVSSYSPFTTPGTRGTVIEHGWNANASYRDWGYQNNGLPKRYDSYATGNTMYDCYKELLNFIV